VKISGFGQATPIDKKNFLRIYDGFLNDQHKLFWAIAYYTGERPITILRSLVDAFYSDPQQRTPRDAILFPAPGRKDRKSREVPLHRNLKLILKAFSPQTEGFLFPSLCRDGEHISIRAIDRALRRSLRRCGLENQGYTLYSPRRGFITELARRGIHPRVIQSLTGHSSLSSLQRYIEISDEQRISAIALLD
jgi:integrase/recombinase XerD